MNRVYFATQLEGVATFWRIYRKDGLTLGFTSHDRDLWFDGVLHRAAPGMVPSSIRLSSDLSSDTAEAQGALSHDTISAGDLSDGRFDGAEIEMGAVDWETLESSTLYSGTIDSVAEEGTQFSAELHSSKAVLASDPIPRTSSGCRAEFCGPGCTLSRSHFMREAKVISSDPATGSVDFGLANPADYLFGFVRWIDGPLGGLVSQVHAAGAGGLTIDPRFEAALPPGTRALVSEGCDHTLATCHARFGNAINFQGEPYLPGNDLLTQYPSAR